MALRPLRSEDLNMILAWRNAPNVRKNMYNSHIISSEEHCSWFKKTKDSSDCKYFICHDKKNCPMGVVYFSEIDHKNLSAFWGFYSSENAPRGTGAKMEYEALEHAFQECKFHKLNCEILASNLSVIKLHKKFGFTEEGFFRDHHFNGVNYVDVVRMGIIDHEWLQNRTNIHRKIAKFI